MMINGLYLASFGSFSYGPFGSLLSQWQSQGVFSFAIPFLLIFAIVYGLLMKIGIFGGKKSEDTLGRIVNGIIALSVSLLSLQFDLVPRFFSELFPLVGASLAIILLIIIFVGLFAPNQTWITYALFGVGVVLIVSILTNVSPIFGTGINIWYFVEQNFAWIILGVFVAIVVISSIPKKSQPDVSSLFMKSLFGGDSKP